MGKRRWSRKVLAAPAAVAFLALLSAAPVRATVLTPGQLILFGPERDWSPDFAPLEGEVLASQTVPVRVSFHSEEQGHDLFADLTLTNQVVRETATGYLSFHYTFDLADRNWNATDLNGVTVTGFRSYFTDARGAAQDDAGRGPVLSRSPDGDGVGFGPGETFAQHLVVRTDAPAFADGGTFSAGVTFQGLEVELGDGYGTVTTFRPVPEPASAVLLVLPLAALSLRRRRPPLMRL